MKCPICGKEVPQYDWTSMVKEGDWCKHRKEDWIKIIENAKKHLEKTKHYTLNYTENNDKMKKILEGLFE